MTSNVQLTQQKVWFPQRPAEFPQNKYIPRFYYHKAKINLECREQVCSMPHCERSLFIQGKKQGITNMVAKINGFNSAPRIVAPSVAAISRKNGGHVPPLPPVPSSASQ